MTKLHVQHVVDRAAADAILAPRIDLLVEDRTGDGRFSQSTGPFERYERQVREIQSYDNGLVNVAETYDYRLAVPLWRPLVNLVMRRGLQDPNRTPRGRWWWPEEVVSQRSATLVSVIALLSVFAGYLGVVISQTITFAAEEFQASDRSQAWTLAGLRFGVFASLILIGRADRIGRKPLLIGFTAASIVFTAAGAFSTGLISLGIAQALARGFDTGLLTLLTLAVTEEVPAKIRAVVLGIMTMCTGLGAGMVVWVLPLADLDVRAWRIIYLVPLVFLPVVLWCWRIMPETRRFDRAAETEASGVVNRKRFVMLAVGAFAATLFLSPASQLQNEYLRDEQGFDAGQISIFRILIGTPVGIPILLAGFLADRKGRKPVGGLGVAIGAVASLLAYFSGGVQLWVSSAISVWLLAAAFTVLRSYSTELFPTRARARIGGWLDLISVAGSFVGLVVVGYLAEVYGSLGPALSVVVWGPLLTAGLVLFAYPETAARELETLNPSDPILDDQPTGHRDP